MVTQYMNRMTFIHLGVPEDRSTCTFVPRVSFVSLMSILGAQQDVFPEGQEHALKCWALMEDA